MIEFFRTVMGQRFIEGTVPRIATALERIAKALEEQNALTRGDNPNPKAEEPGESVTRRRPHPVNQITEKQVRTVAEVMLYGCDLADPEVEHTLRTRPESWVCDHWDRPEVVSIAMEQGVSADAMDERAFTRISDAYSTLCNKLFNTPT